MNTETNTVATTPALIVGTRVVLTKGCKARGLDKGITAQIIEVRAMGAEYGHCVKVAIKPLNGFKTASTFAFFARHVNRLTDAIVRMNDGNPSHTIEVRRAIRQP